MLNGKTGLQKSVLVLIGVLLMIAAAACNGSAQTTTEAKTAADTAAAVPAAADTAAADMIVEETAVTQSAATLTTARPSKARQLFNRMGQSDGDEPVDDEMDLWEGVDWFALAAEAAGMDDDALWDALMNGSSIAELITANGGDPAALVERIAADETAWINSLVEAGEITEEEAADWTVDLTADIQEFVDDSSWALWEGIDWFTVAAETIGVDEDALWEADSIAAIAQAQDIRPQTVIDAIAAAETAWINELTAAGELTEEEAADWISFLNEDITAFVEESWDMGDFEGVDWLTVAAEAIGVDVDTLWEADSIADVAAENGVESQTVINAIVAAETAWVDEQVANDEMTAEDAADWKSVVEEDARSFVENDWDIDEFGGVDWFTVAAEAIGVDEDTLWEVNSIAEAAAENGVESQTVIDAIVAAETVWIDEMVADGTFTEEEAADWMADIGEEARSFVEDSWEMDEFEGVDWFIVAAEAIGVDEDTLWEADSIADAAAENGVENQTVIDAIAAAEIAWMDEMVADGTFTEEEAAEWTEELDEEIRSFVEDSWGMDDFGGIDWFVIAAETIGVDEEALWEADSIKAIAEEQNVEPQTIMDAISTAETAWVNEMVADGEWTEEEAADWTEDLAEEIRSFVEETWE